MSQLFVDAYNLYRSNNLVEAENVLNSLPLQKLNSDEQLGVQHLRAQIHYRKEEFGECVKEYHQLLLNDKDNNDLLVNFLASCAAHGLFLSDVDKTRITAATGTSQENLPSEISKYLSQFVNDKLSNESYEIAYNAACTAISVKKLSLAEKYLHIAADICERMAKEEDSDDQEIINELSAIRTQQALLMQINNNNNNNNSDENVSQVVEAYNAVLKSKSTDGAVTSIASSNITALRKEHEMFDSFRRTKTSLTSALEQRLFSTQKRAIALNRALLLIYMNKYEMCRALIETLDKEFPDGELSCLVLASSYFHEKKFTKCEDTLKNYLLQLSNRKNSSASANNVVLVTMILAHLYLARGDREGCRLALEKLNGILQLQYKPGIIATSVAIYEKLNDIEGASSYLEDALSKKNDSRELLEFAGSLFMKYRKYQQASNCFSKLLALKDVSNIDESKKTLWLAGMVQATAGIDAAEARKFASSLAMPFELLSSAEIDALENLPSISSSSSSSSSSTENNVKDKNEKIIDLKGKDNGGKDVGKDGKEKRKRKRKMRLPKNYDPNVPPDPDRWKPKHLRAGYKKIKRKNKNSNKDDNAMKGSQGAVASATATSSSTSGVVQVQQPVTSSSSSSSKKGKRK